MPFKIGPDVEDAVFEDIVDEAVPEKGVVASEFAKKSAFSGVLKKISHVVRAVGEEVSPRLAGKARDAGRQPGFSWRL